MTALQGIRLSALLLLLAACGCAQRTSLPEREWAPIRFENGRDDVARWHTLISGEISATTQTTAGRWSLRYDYDFRSAIDGQFRIFFDQPMDMSAATGLRFRVRGDGSGQMLRVALSVGDPEKPGGKVFGRRVPIYLDFTGWHEFFFPWEDFYVFPEFRDEIGAVIFIMDYINPRGPLHSHILLDDVAFVDRRPRPSQFVELETDADFFAEVDLDYPGLETCREAVRRGDWPAARAAFVEHMRTRSAPLYYLRAKDREEMLNLHAEMYGQGALTAPGKMERYTNYMNQNISYINLKIDGPMQWDNFGPGVNGLQIAVLHRFGWLPELGQAYWATGEDKYAEKAVEYIASFNDWRMGCEVLGRAENAPRSSWGWPRDLEVGERPRSWMKTYAFIKDHPSFTVNRQFQMFRAMFHHAQWLYASNVMSFESWNHQIIRTLGEAEIAIFMPEFKRSGQWLEQALDILMQHLERETLADGAYFELTPGYGGWVAKNYLLFLHLARMNGVPLPQGFAARCERMPEWFAAQAAPNGMLPATGDARYGTRVEKHVNHAAAILNRPDYRFLGGDVAIEDDTFWLLGPDALRRYANMQPVPPDWTARLLEASGCLTLRSGWEKDAHYLFMNAMIEGGGHCHPDSLQIDFHAFAQPIFADPGIHDWNDPDFPFLDSARANSIVQVDGETIPTFNPVIDQWQKNGVFDLASAWIEYPDGLRHRRSVLFLKPETFVVWDQLRPTRGDTATHTYEQVWRLAAGDVAIAGMEEDTARIRAGEREVSVRAQAFPVTGAWGPDTQRPDLDSIPKAAVYTVHAVGPVDVVDIFETKRVPSEEAGGVLESMECDEKGMLRMVIRKKNGSVLQIRWDESGVEIE